MTNEARLTIFAILNIDGSDRKFGYEQKIREETVPIVKKFADCDHLAASILDSLDRLVSDGIEKISYEFHLRRGGVLDIPVDGTADFTEPLGEDDMCKIERAIKIWYNNR